MQIFIRRGTYAPKLEKRGTATDADQRRHDDDDDDDVAFIDSRSSHGTPPHSRRKTLHASLTHGYARRVINNTARRCSLYFRRLRREERRERKEILQTLHYITLISI